jgi:hypothetical protein
VHQLDAGNRDRRITELLEPQHRSNALLHTPMVLLNQVFRYFDERSFVCAGNEGEVLDVLVQARRDKEAALRLMRKLLKNYGLVPTSIVTDRYRAYDAAFRDLGLSGIHRRGKRLNNRAESSHVPLRRRERKMQGFRSAGSAQRFLSSYSKHGSHSRRRWRELHIGINAATHEVVVAELTPDDVGDVSTVTGLLEQVDSNVASLTADGAYDGAAAYDAIAKRHPAAVVIVPPRGTAVANDRVTIWRDARWMLSRHAACWLWRRFVTAAAAARRRALAMSACRSFETGCCGSTRWDRMAWSNARHRDRSDD